MTSSTVSRGYGAVLSSQAGAKHFIDQPIKEHSQDVTCSGRTSDLVSMASRLRATLPVFAGAFS